jgi:hypothetical protein
LHCSGDVLISTCHTRITLRHWNQPLSLLFLVSLLLFLRCSLLIVCSTLLGLCWRRLCTRLRPTRRLLGQAAGPSNVRPFKRFSR